MIDWSEPIFHDNSVTPLTIVRTPDKIELPNVNENHTGNVNEGIGMGMFPIGETVIVSYTAIDATGNNSTCKLDITVQGIVFKHVLKNHIAAIHEGKKPYNCNISGKDLSFFQCL